MNQIVRNHIVENNGKFTVRVGLGHADKLRAALDKFFSEEPQAADGVNKIAAGIVFMAPSGKVLLLKRSEDEPNYGGYWGLPGGKAEEGESAVDAAMREAREETGYADDFDIMRELSKVTTPNGMEFTTYLVKAREEFTPSLTDGEHTDWRWVDPMDWPTDPPGGEKVHPGVDDTLEALALMRIGGAADSIALDKDSVRTVDDAGRMHIASAHISKATVNPYYGREIPGWEPLGLDPEKVYQLFRDPAELEKAAASFNSIQILIRHIPVSADEPQQDDVVGATGSSAVFNAPYLDNELVIWTREGIDAIESGAQRELSCGYAYTPVMEAGEFEGQPYDGRMTEIKGNHVALVSKGRAGPDVIVGDAALEQRKEVTMTKPLSRTAVRVQAALSAFLLPKIALDQQLKMSTALGTALSNLGSSEKITRAALAKPNFRAAIVKMAKDTAEPLMTAEAKKAGFGPDDVVMRVLDMVQGQGADEPEDDVVDSEPSDDWRKNVMDALMKGGMDEKAAGTICDMFPKAAVAAPAKDEEETDEERAAKEKAAKEKTEKEKGAMDEQIKAGIAAAVENERKRSKEAAEARQFVEPWVGKVSLAHDSAEDIYRTTLGMLGVKHEAVREPSALRILVEAQQKPHERRQHAHSFAADAAPEGKAFTDMFPGADRIGNAA